MAYFGHGSPQVGRSHRTHEAGPDNALLIRDDGNRDGIDVVLPMERGCGRIFDVDDADLSATQHFGLRHHVGTRGA